MAKNLYLGICVVAILTILFINLASAGTTGKFTIDTNSIKDVSQVSLDQNQSICSVSNNLSNCQDDSEEGNKVFSFIKNLFGKFFDFFKKEK